MTMDAITRTVAQRVSEVRARGGLFARDNMAVWAVLVTGEGYPSDEVMKAIDALDAMAVAS